jgi:hypothetical protein
MTQIIGALTQDFVVVASDRRLTFPPGDRIAEDNACKLVSLCGVAGIAYTGFARLQGAPTNEWIAVRLAERECRHPAMAAQILVEAAGPALKASPHPAELSFLIAGWAPLTSDPKSLSPQFWLVSNMFGPEKEQLSAPGPTFRAFNRILKSNEEYAGRIVGAPLAKGRGKHLHRSFRRLMKHGTGPKLALRALVDEVINT